MAESNSGAHLTPGAGQYAFIPSIVTALNVDQSEVGNTVTPFGAGLGLTNADINGNASHVVFTYINGYSVVDRATRPAASSPSPAATGDPGRADLVEPYQGRLHPLINFCLWKQERPAAPSGGAGRFSAGSRATEGGSAPLSAAARTGS